MNANIADLLKKISTYIDLSTRKPLPEIERDILLRNIQELYVAVKYNEDYSGSLPAFAPTAIEDTVKESRIVPEVVQQKVSEPIYKPVVAEPVQQPIVAEPVQEIVPETVKEVTAYEPVQEEEEEEAENDTHISIQQLVRESLKQKEELAEPVAEKVPEPVFTPAPVQEVEEEVYAHETEEEALALEEDVEEEDSEDLLTDEEDITQDEDEESFEDNSNKPKSINEIYKTNSGSLYEKAQTAATGSVHSSMQHQSVKSQIDLNRRILFTRDLFNSDGIAYNHFIESLDFCNTFEEARDKVNSKAKELKWKGDSQTVRLLVKLVKTRFGM